MALLKCVLRAFQVLAVLFSLSAFTFDSAQRRFKLHAELRLWVKLMHYVQVFPSMLVMGAVIGIMLMDQLVAIVEHNFEGSSATIAMYFSLAFLGFESRYVLTAYIIYLNKERVGQLEQLLNDFVDVYDQYVALFGPKLKVKWYAGAALLCQIFTLDIILLWLFVYTPKEKLVFGFILLTMGTPTTGLIASLVALLLLNALFRGATLSTKHVLWQKRLDRRCTLQLLRFYDDLMRLRDNLEQYMKPFIVAQLLVETLCFLMLLQFMRQLGPATLLSIACTLVYPTVYACLCDQMATAQLNMGNELLTLGCEYVAAEDMKLVEFFCLQKSLFETIKGRSWRMLHVRKDFVLEFANFCWVQGIFLMSIVFTDVMIRSRTLGQEHYKPA